MEYIFDTHAHYDDEAFDPDREELIAGLRNLGIGWVTNVAASMESCKTTLALAKKYPFFYAAVGVHPTETKDLTEEDMKWIQAASGDEKVRAIGEIGLDYYWDEPERELQKKWFVRQLKLAKEVRLPVIIHSRDAAQDTLELMKAHHSGSTGGVIHCLSYGTEIAREYLNMGYFLGVGGVVTYKNGRKLKEVVEYAPLSQIVLETDCPYLSPVPYRGKRNFSGNLPLVAEEIANIKGITAEEVIRETTKNAARLYGLSLSEL